MNKHFFAQHRSKISRVIVSSLLTLLFTCLAVFVLSYVSLAVMIGPWIDPTLALCGLGLLSLSAWFSWRGVSRSEMLLVVAAGSMGGLIASAAVWSIPTLYFLDNAYFISLLERPMYFIGGIMALVCAAGSVGMLVARCTAFAWLDTEQYAFPIAQLVVRTLTVFGNVYQFCLLGLGAVSAVLFHAAQLVRWGIPSTISLMQQKIINSWMCLPHIIINMNTAPMLWAVGFIAGNLLVVPLCVGMLLRLLLMDPCYRLWFSLHLSQQNFATAFCTGIIIQGVVYSFWKLLLTWRKSSIKGSPPLAIRVMHLMSWLLPLRNMGYYAVGVVACAALVLRCIAHLSWVSIFYVLIASAVCGYQLILLMGRIGLAPLGRFATFVMVPGLLLFRFNGLQATVVAAFVELVGAVAASAASGMRIAQSARRDEQSESIYYYQAIALFISALAVGVVMWVFATYFGFGVPPLLAQRAQARALLIGAHEMHMGVLLVGVLVGFTLQALTNINTTLLLGGILMSTSDTLMLIAGGALSYMWHEPAKLEPFWSGVFTASSLWMMSRILL